MAKVSKDKFSKRETEERMKAALRGARITGHKPMSKIAPKRKVDRAATKQGKERI